MPHLYGLTRLTRQCPIRYLMCSILLELYGFPGSTPISCRFYAAFSGLSLSKSQAPSGPTETLCFCHRHPRSESDPIQHPTIYGLTRHPSTGRGLEAHQ